MQASLSISLTALSFSALLLCATQARTTAATVQEQWPAFRGAHARNTAAEDPRLPDSWSQTENVVWNAEVPGLGWSSPIVTDGKVFVTSVWSDGELEEPRKGLYMGGERMSPSKSVHHWAVHCFQLEDGSQCWQRVVHSGAPAFTHHLKNTYASETPVTDGERIYAYFGNLGVWALDFEGNVLWEHRLERVQTRFGWGSAASPVIDDGTLYLVNDNETESYLLALDARTGEQKWRVVREDEGTNWATPFIWHNARRTEIVTAGTHKVRSYDLEGNLLWWFSGMSSIVIPQPFAAHGLLFVTSGYVGDSKRPVFAVNPGASGDISLTGDSKSNAWIEWFLPRGGPYNPTPVVYDGIYYTLFDGGFLTAHDAKTGEEIYSKRRLEAGSAGFTASPWAYNGKVFALNEDGDTFVVEAGREFKVLGKSSLDEMCMATPAIADGSLILRTRSKLYRITDLSADAASASRD